MLKGRFAPVCCLSHPLLLNVFSLSCLLLLRNFSLNWSGKCFSKSLVKLIISRHNIWYLYNTVLSPPPPHPPHIYNVNVLLRTPLVITSGRVWSVTFRVKSIYVSFLKFPFSMALVFTSIKWYGWRETQSELWTFKFYRNSLTMPLIVLAE